MFRITRQQVKALDKIPLDIFLKKVQDSAVEIFGESETSFASMEHITQLYKQAIATGRNTEKGIADFILAQLRKDAQS